MSPELSKDLSEAYFQALCQSVVDMNEVRLPRRCLVRFYYAHTAL